MEQSELERRLHVGRSAWRQCLESRDQQAGRRREAGVAGEGGVRGGKQSSSTGLPRIDELANKRNRDDKRCLYAHMLYNKKAWETKKKSHKTSGPQAAGLKPLGFDSAVPAARTKDQGRVKFHEKSQDRDRGREGYNSRRHIWRRGCNPTLLYCVGTV